MDFETNFSYGFLPEEGGSVLKERKKARVKAAEEKKKGTGTEAGEEKGKFDAKKMIIYSEIMNPKFKE